jgi:hypothetical protein
MKVFHCDHCAHLLFFENTSCIQCGRQVAYLPDLGDMGSLEPLGDGRWRSPLPAARDRSYRLCRNYVEMDVCNWAISSDDPNPLCVSCRLTRLIPDVSQAATRLAWYKLEVAKRRLVFTLEELELPLGPGVATGDPGLAFEFKADPTDPNAPRVMTGHAAGVITVNIAEADDAERERRRAAVHEPYRTLLGHMRHESGHYYWGRLVKDQASVESFRRLFGDERADYGSSLRTHYEQGPPADWLSRFVSSYASSHPWEDWAETWAHYLHMFDALETAAACGLSLKPRRTDEPALANVPAVAGRRRQTFDRVIDSWFPVTYALNNLNRGLGLPDGYPFVLSTPAIDKLRFVHDVIASGPG